MGGVSAYDQGQPLGGMTFPEPLTVQPEGRPGYCVFETEALLTVDTVQPPAPGVEHVVQSACVPEKGITLPDDVDVMAGAAVSVCEPPALPLTLPPVDSIDVHAPL